MQNGVILGVVLLILGALILPLFGISLGAFFNPTGSGGGGGGGFNGYSYDQADFSASGSDADYLGGGGGGRPFDTLSKR
jgi:hypothetical protein